MIAKWDELKRIEALCKYLERLSEGKGKAGLDLTLTRKDLQIIINALKREEERCNYPYSVYRAKRGIKG